MPRLVSTVVAIVFTMAAGAWSADDVPEKSRRLQDGRFGQALDANHGGFIAPANEAYARQPITIELWAKSTKQHAERVLICNDARNSATHWDLSIDRKGLVSLRARRLGVLVVLAENPITDDRWHHIVATLEKDRVQIFIDAKLSASAKVTWQNGPPQPSGLAIGTRIDDKQPAPVLIDDVRISRGVREVLAVPNQPLIKDDATISLWTFDESEKDYLAKWTPGGETNQRDLPYPHRYAAFEFEKDPQWVDNRWQEMDKGPFVTHSTQIPGHQTGAKNIVVFLNKQKTLAAMFDLQRCGTVAGVVNSHLKTGAVRFGLMQRPILNGDVQFYVQPAKSWRVASGETLVAADPTQVDYRGLHLRDDQVLLSYRILGGEALAMPGAETKESITAITQQLEVVGLSREAYLTVSEMKSPPKLRNLGRVTIASSEADGVVSAVALAHSSADDVLQTRGRDVMLKIAANAAWTGKLLFWSGKAEDLPAFETLAAASSAGSKLDDLKKPAARRWGDALATKGQLGEAKSAYVIDTITVPYENPFRALFFISGVDFFSSGDAAVCTAHGDVWIVRGLDDTLNEVRWHRFATGLYQPLGLKVVDDKVIVLGRDQLTRLHDLNGDGEADFYESFNNDLVIEGRGHAFAMRLETDPDGNFYFLKSGGQPHGSSLLKVTADGSKLSVHATGFRHPYGLGAGPRGEITVADNEGGWVPSSKIDLIQEGGFYGFLGGAKSAPEGKRPSRPLCYIPKVADNSCGGQTWVTSDKWGDYHRGEMLHLSWGRCTLHAVLRQQVNDIWQAATVRFPGLTFLSGSGTAAFHPTDGQLYVVGLDGWQTGAVKDGCFQRVRYTGRQVYMPETFEAYKNGVLIRFTQPIESTTASDPANYRAEQWNYRWSSTYGSFHYSISDPDKIGHDALEIKSSQLLSDGHSVFLEIPGLQPADQLHVHTNIKAADNTRLQFNLYGTINALPSAAYTVTKPSTRDKPNIVIVLVDDMGYGDPGCFNSASKIPTPHIDSLARDGMRFTDAHAPGPLCHMSRYGLMTGRYPFRTNVGLWRKQPLIERDQMTIATLAKSQGYRTAMVGKWHLGFKEDGYDKPLPGGPVDCGFQSYFGIRASTDIPPYFYIRGDRAVQPPSDRVEANSSEGWSPIQGAFWRAGGIAPDLTLDDVLPRFTSEAVQVIGQHAKDKDARPLMLYLAYPAPHTPWLPSKEFVGKSGAGMYGDFLMMVDAQIGEVLAALHKAGMDENTLMIFTSDNGPVWYDADVKRLGHDSSGGLRGMKADAWEAGHRMPFIVRWPQHVKAGSQSTQLVCFTDLLATFADVLDAELPAAAGPDSFSFLSALTGQEAKLTPVRRQFVMRPGSASMMTIRSGEWKLITGLGSGGFSRPNRIKPGSGEPLGQLYNLADDLGETTNLYAKHPDIVARLTAELKTIVDAGRSRRTTADARTDPSRED